MPPATSAAPCSAILSWGQTVARHDSRRAGRRTRTTAAASCRRARRRGGAERLGAKEQGSLAGDVDALVSALDARAALEIGITQALGDWLTNEAERDALVARLRAFTPLVRGTTPAHVSRYIRASDAFHRIFFSLLRNPALFEIYNAMDLPELMRRVLEVAPISIREVFDDHKALDRRAAQRRRQCHLRRHDRKGQPRPRRARQLPGRRVQGRPSAAVA